ncbi:MAG: GLPGLI family protein [Prevotellaceae bacterium]|nr:GLPGLI family protein [Prevotellaceae bacterium]
MKTKILIAALFCACSINSVKSQSIQVIYETQPKIQLNTNGLDKSIVEQIMKSSRIKTMLCCKDGESTYKTLKNEDSSSGVNIISPENITYKNYNTNKEISFRDFLGKEFLIESELATDEWTIIDSTKDICGYTCTKAISKNKEKETAVWFCPHLPINDGPVYTGLNGLVLETVSENVTITAVEISTDADCDIIIPSKGKKIHKAEFDKMVEKRTKALQQEAETSGSGISIKIIR